jgi:hypothetical protein
VTYRVEIKSASLHRWLLWRRFDTQEQANREVAKLESCYPRGALRVVSAGREACGRDVHAPTMPPPAA